MYNSSMVSVIIPTHKGSENISKAVNSVLSQTYKNIEIIVVDDNGKGTPEQIKTEQALGEHIKEGRIKYLTHEKNINGSAARNTGIREARGEFISFLDDDDNYTQQNIEKHMEVFEGLSQEYGMTYCDARKIRKGHVDEFFTANKSGEILFDYLIHNVPIGTNCIMLRRETIDYANGFDESFKRHQDWEFLTRILDRYKAAHVDYVGSERYVTDRHNAPNPQVYEKNRIHFLEKVEYIVKKLNPEQQRKFYDMHYTDIGKEYLKKGDIRECVRWAVKTSNPAKCIANYAVAAAMFVCGKCKGLIKKL